MRHTDESTLIAQASDDVSAALIRAGSLLAQKTPEIPLFGFDLFPNDDTIWSRFLGSQCTLN
jgi:hypothetical protein